MAKDELRDAIRERLGQYFGDKHWLDKFDASDFEPKAVQASAGGWLTWLADVLRAAGLSVIEYPGWQNRARSSGPYAAGKPLCVMWHHTASPASWNGQKDADYCAVGDEDAPLANLYIDRQGTVWVLAAGATNTNGKGKSIVFSRGTVPIDQMNTHAIGVEMGNDGVGEAWPEVQVDAMFAVSNACNAALGNQPNDVATHNYYAPDRKIDPATAAAVQGPWKPKSVTSSGTWDLVDIESECLNRAGSEPHPIPPQPGPGPAPEDDDMRLYVYSDQNGTYWVGTGVERWTLGNMDEFSQLVVLSSTGGGPLLISANGIQVRQAQDVAVVGQATIDALGRQV